MRFAESAGIRCVSIWPDILIEDLEKEVRQLK